MVEFRVFFVSMRHSPLESRNVCRKLDLYRGMELVAVPFTTLGGKMKILRAVCTEFHHAWDTRIIRGNLEWKNLGQRFDYDSRKV